MLSIFSPAMTLIIYAIQAEWRGTKSVDVNLAFTSLAIVTMVTGPANNVLTRMAHAASALAAFDRIQKYVSSPDRHDERQIMDKKRTDGPGGHGNGKSAVEFAEATRAPIVSIQSSDVDDLVVVVVGDVTIRPAPSANPVLRNLKMDIKEGSLNICSGAVGTGKTTLIKALLGELPSDSGTIQTSDRLIAYCSQTAWLPNGTIKDIVRGPLATDNETDEAWYGRVLKACDLDEDLHQLLDGDQTVIGSRGIMLSGGQKQRVVRHHFSPTCAWQAPSRQRAILITLGTGSSTCRLCALPHSRPGRCSQCTRCYHGEPHCQRPPRAGRVV